ncbi:HNH endonuclease [Amycolatopsis acidicola]|uniref:HNH endonuclease n=1 Tax=Amycolatopsis acidicola TaxID=2596893 RepID=A0A5N0UWC3_9PSEU|nr:HNH endonuclease [Amycolatopsis acidicola]KAA9154566.1 HNH endonuclease [Amycolatopsis acidicola]
MAGTAARPDWRNGKLGTRVRVALWLVSEIGEGRKFTKSQLRNAMPGVEQIDRRMRDLRPAGWSILTYRDLNSLAPGELLLDKIGLPIWEKEHRAAGLRSVTATVRRRVLERDGHRCVRCGILAGEQYPDGTGSTARLTVGHVNPHKYGAGATEADLVTECARCNETAKHLTGLKLDEQRVWDELTELPGRDKQIVLNWLVAGRREPSRAEKAVSHVWQLPAVQRESIEAKLARLLSS